MNHPDSSINSRGVTELSGSCGFITGPEARVSELESVLRWIVNCTDSEMRDGDGAREVAKSALGVR